MNIMQRVVPAGTASHELLIPGSASPSAAQASTSETRRVSLARFAWFVIVYNVAVIGWGAYVRATGSGNVCGSYWPLCNGEVVPTTTHKQTMIEFSHRVTSGAALVLVAVLLVWCWRSTAKGEWPRGSVVAAAALLLNEALLGALLVLVDHLGSLSQSATHALFLCLHFGNTLCLLAALALTARWLSSSYARFAFVRTPYQLIATSVGLLSIMVVGISGSLAGLGDILFPADSLRQAFLKDFSSSSPTLLRLRTLHPIAAVIGSLYVLWLFLAFWRKREHSRWLVVLPVTLTTQISLGVVNVMLLAPIWLQMTHLLVAEIFWIVFVLASADQLLASRQLGAFSGTNGTVTSRSLACRTTNRASRGGGLSL
jgi:heme a synthase